jgi:hypothetical protein
LAITFIIGSFITRVKDWLFWRYRQLQASNSLFLSSLNLPAERDPGRDKARDEITSAMIWLILALFCLEFSAKEFGFGLSKLIHIFYN